MAKGISVHVGLNRVDPAHYEPLPDELGACEQDAKDMQSIAQACGFQTALLLNEHASSAAVLGALNQAASTLEAGDFLFLTYSGHGSQIKDTNGDEEYDGLDETWCLYDRMLVDDELYAVWGNLQPGARVLMLSDSCHSGSMSKMYRDMGLSSFLSSSRPMLESAGVGTDSPTAYRGLTPDVARCTYERNKDEYIRIQTQTGVVDRSAIGARVILISGCQDNQTSGDGPVNGVFTGRLLAVWNSGKYRQGYRTFHKEVRRRMPPTQSPNYYCVGVPNPDFEGSQVLSI